MKTYNIIIETPHGFQQIIEVGHGGRHREDKTVWNENVHGPIPNGTVMGGLQRYDDQGVEKLRVNSSLKSSQDALKVIFDQAALLRKNRIRDARIAMKNNIDAASSLDDVKNLIKHIARLI